MVFFNVSRLWMGIEGGRFFFLIAWNGDGKLFKFFSQIVLNCLVCRYFMSAFIISLSALERNALILRNVADDAGCCIALALKGFSCWQCFDVLTPLLDGCCASGLWEARLAQRRFGKHVLTYSPGHAPDEVAELADISTHFDFNSLTQWYHFRNEVMSHPRFISGELKCGLRINPKCSTGHTPIYDPCAQGSRLGITPEVMKNADLTGISGLHFHTLCEQGADDLAVTLEAVEHHFGYLLSRPEISWLNMGGGHWITKPDYDRKLLVELIRLIRKRYGLEVWLEPGEAVAIHTGVLRCRVLDIFYSEGLNHAILDVSASAHMPDTLEMPYRPDVFQIIRDKSFSSELQPAVVLPGENYAMAREAGIGAHTYRLGAPTCLAGDRIGDYSFPEPLSVGDELVFDDMAHYTMVKTSFFNGVRHPDIAIQEKDGSVKLVRRFSYEDFETRLG